MNYWGRLGAMMLVVLAGAASGQTTDPRAAAMQDSAAPPPPVAEQTTTRVRGVLANTLVDIEIAVALNSKANKIGDTFPIRLAEPLRNAAGTILLPAGTRGQGEVIHAARARAMGKAGEMILAARYLQCGDTRIPLGHLKFGMAGKNNAGTVIAASVAVGVVAMFIAGGEVNVPAGTRANAKITADVALSAEATAACGADPQS